MNEVSEKIAKILEDPESIKMISEIAGNFMGAASAEEHTQNNDNTADDSVKETAETVVTEHIGVSNTLSPAVGKLLEGADIDNTVRLVSALKPFMSTRRRDSAESVLRILGVMKLVGNNNFTEMAKLFGK